MPTAFTRTVEQAQEAGFTPTRRTVSIVAVKQLTAGIVRLTFRDEYIAHHVRPAQFVNLYSARTPCTSCHVLSESARWMATR